MELVGGAYPFLETAQVCLSALAKNLHPAAIAAKGVADEVAAEQPPGEAAATWPSVHIVQVGVALPSAAEYPTPQATQEFGVVVVTNL